MVWMVWMVRMVRMAWMVCRYNVSGWQEWWRGLIILLPYPLSLIIEDPDNHITRNTKPMMDFKPVLWFGKSPHSSTCLNIFSEIEIRKYFMNCSMSYVQTTSIDSIASLARLLHTDLDIQSLRRAAFTMVLTIVSASLQTHIIHRQAIWESSQHIYVRLPQTCPSTLSWGMSNPSITLNTPGTIRKQRIQQVLKPDVRTSRCSL